MISNSLSGDVVFLLTSVNECGMEISNTNIEIEGSADKFLSLSCSRNSSVQETYILFYPRTTHLVVDAPVAFIIKNSTATFRRIRFVQGYILSVNSSLFIEESHIHNTVLFLMDQTHFVNYINKTLNRYSLQGLSSSNGERPTDFCLHSSLSFHGVVYHHLEWALHNAIPLVELPKDGIQANCREISIHIENSYLADKLIFVFALTKLHFNLLNGHLEGTDTGQNTQGGIELQFACPPSVRIEDSSFTKLKFFSLLYALFSDQVQMKKAALTLKR